MGLEKIGRLASSNFDAVMDMTEIESVISSMAGMVKAIDKTTEIMESIVRNNFVHIYELAETRSKIMKIVEKETGR